METNYKDKTIIITGATGILGSQFCNAFAEQGGNICILDLDQKKCDELASKIKENHSVKALSLQCDVSDPKSVNECFVSIKSNFNTIDVLINNAASKSESLKKFFSSFEDYSLETWHQVMSVNVDGSFLMAQAAGKLMKDQGFGNIVQISSIYGVVAPDQRIYEGSSYMGGAINTPAVYSTSKAAVIGLTKYLAAYWGEFGVRVNCLTPGGVESGQNEAFKNNYSNRVPLKKMAEPIDMVQGALFLASDSAKYITGHNLIIDGGLTVW